MAWTWHPTTWAEFWRTGSFGYYGPDPSPLITKYVPPANAVSIIGIQPGTAVLIHSESNATGAGVSFAQTIFDTTTRADSARILLTNSTGATGYVRGAAINAKVVTMLSGQEGFLNDKYVDYESINANGELKFEIGNNFIVTITQVNQLADYAWKNNKTKRHIHTISLVGMCTFFEPGEWYTITIGSAGTAENISVVCECYSVRSSLTSDDLGITSVAFREMYQNWVFDSNETARSIASGQFGRFPDKVTVTVASSTYLDTANYYCDGVNDDVEINAATTYLTSRGGGRLQFTEGTFNITSSITVLSNITYAGQGDGTIIKKADTTSFTTIYAAGSAGNIISNVNLIDFQLQATSVDSTLGVGIGYSYVKNSTIQNVVAQPLSLPFSFTQTDGLIMKNCIVQGTGVTRSLATYGIYFATVATSYSNIIQSCIIKNIVSSVHTVGIFAQDTSPNSLQLVNNEIYSLSCTATSVTNAGIWIEANGTIVGSNRVTSCSASSSLMIGIFIATASTNVAVHNNYCFNNGLDTGLANTNTNNFRDSGTDTQVG